MMEDLNTKTKLLNKVKELEQEKRQVMLGYEKDELYSSYQKNLDELRAKEELLRQEMYRLRQEYQEKVREDIKFFDSEISYMKSLANKSDGLPVENQSFEVQEVFKKYCRGLAMPSDLTRITWVSADEDYAVFKRRGYGGGTGFSAYYVEVEYRLYHIPTEFENIQKKYSTSIVHGSGGIMGWYSKRWSKAKFKEVKESILKHKFETKKD